MDQAHALFFCQRFLEIVFEIVPVCVCWFCQAFNSFLLNNDLCFDRECSQAGYAKFHFSCFRQEFAFVVFCSRIADPDCADASMPGRSRRLPHSRVRSENPRQTAGPVYLNECESLFHRF